jgi:chromosomal replication initiator protein
MVYLWVNFLGGHMTNPLEENLYGFYTNLHEKVNNDDWNLWFDGMKVTAIENQKVILKVDNLFKKSWLDGNYSKLIADTIKETFGINYIFEITIPSASEEREKSDTPKKLIRKRSLLLSTFHHKYRFDNFIVGDDNLLAYNAALSVAKNPGTKFNPLFFYSRVGLGKTHLLQGIGHYILENNPDMRVMYVTSEQFGNDMIKSIVKKNTLEFKGKYRSADILLIDDIQFLTGKPAIQEEFFHTFNTLYNAGKQIVITSDKRPSEISGLEERLTSRFEMGLLISLDSPKFETRIRILQKLCEQDDITVSDDVINYIAKVANKNVRQLEGAFTRVVAASSLLNKPLTLELVKESLANMVSIEPKEESDLVNKELTPSLILREVANEFGVTVESLKAKSRGKKIVVARQMSVYLIRNILGVNFKQIAKILNRSDHSSSNYMYKRALKILDKDQRLYNMIMTIRKNLTEGS